VAPDQRAVAGQEVRLLVEEGKALPPQERRYRRLDGTWVDVESSGAALAVDGRPALLWIVRDISQRKEVDRLKNEFVSTVSHELRTPLTSIRGSLSLISAGAFGALPAEVKPVLEIASVNCERLVRLINDILDIEKIEAGKMDFRCRPVELAPLLQAALVAARGLADSVNVRLVLEETAPEARASADPDRLLQVLANLLSNAVKFSPSPSRVDVALRRRGDRWKVSVRDRGAGIPQDFRARIFQKFAQADGSDTRQKGGTGLGLSICKVIVERMGGTIGFEDAPDGGTIFYFELPAAGVPEPAPSAPVRDVRRAGAPILVVEDDPDVALLLSLMLRQAGHRPDVAKDVAEARAKLASGEYALATLDVMLPDESGVSFLRELRRSEATRSLPFVMISAKAEAARRQVEGSGLAVVDWLDKPIAPERLKAAVDAALRSGSLPRVLHVEDDPGVLETLRAEIADLAETVGARSLAEARGLLASSSFDLVLLDDVLPDGSGLDLLPLSVPVLVYSAYDVADERVARAFVKSRASREDLRAAIRAALGTPAEAAVSEVRP
jgi:signal transduction histidine kinase/DNA-binding response OmpR family regulator